MKVYRNILNAPQGSGRLRCLLCHHQHSSHCPSHEPVVKGGPMKIKATLPFDFPLKGSTCFCSAFFVPLSSYNAARWQNVMLSSPRKPSLGGSILRNCEEPLNFKDRTAKHQLGPFVPRGWLDPMSTCASFATFKSSEVLNLRPSVGF